MDGFLVDFYWYDDGPYLESALDDGLTAASNVSDIEFALMWANHTLHDIFPADQSAERKVLKSGAIDRAAFERMADHIVDSYFVHPSYLKIDGRPWFSIYEIGNFIAGLGGVGPATDALEYLSRRARERGFAGVHLDAVVWGIAVLPNGVVVDDPAQMLRQLGVHSATSYVWTHHSDLTAAEFPVGDWARVRHDAFEDYESLAATLPVPMHPNVTVGWDASPRTTQEASFIRSEYPWTPVFDAGPEEFELGLRLAADFVKEHAAKHPVVTINAWNEWTEGSYLLPDSTYGLAYLEAIKRVFPPAQTSGISDNHPTQTSNHNRFEGESIE